MPIEAVAAVAFVVGACAGSMLTVSVGRGRELAFGRAAYAPAPMEIETPAAVAVQPQIAAPVARQPETDAEPTPLPALGRRAVVVPMRTAAEHAAALLKFLQGPGGLVGELTAREIEASYSDLMVDLEWQPRPWPGVAKALRCALGNARKTYGYRNGTRVRVWRIPPAPLHLPAAAENAVNQEPLQIAA